MVGAEITCKIIGYDILNIIGHCNGGSCFWICRFICVLAPGVQPLLLVQAKDDLQQHPVRPPVDKQLMEKGSSSSSLHRTVSELTSLVKSDVTWTKVSKGYRSSSRRPRSSVNINMKASGELANKDSKGLEMPVSESEKLGVSVLGCRFNEKVEHVPIKKRRFKFRAPSPPHKTSSLCLERTERHGKSHNAVSGLVGDVAQTYSSDNKIYGKSLVKASERTGEDEDFSGISILAAAACCISLGGDLDCDVGSGDFLSRKGSLEASVADESEAELVKPANMSTEESGSCASTAPSKGAASSTMDSLSPDKHILDGSSSQVLEVAAPQVLPSKKNQEEKSKTQESSVRDDRLHWDLNTVMDAWEQPFEYKHEISLADVSGSNLKYTKEEKHVFKEGNSDGGEFGKESGGAYYDIGKTVPPVNLRSMANEIEVSKMEECKPDGCVDISGAVMFEAKWLSSKTDSALNLVVKRTESLQHIGSIDDGSLADNPSKLNSEDPASAAVAKCVNLDCKSTDDLCCGEVVGMDSLEDCSPPPGFDIPMKMRVSKQVFNGPSAVVGCRNNINEPISHVKTPVSICFRSESEKQNSFEEACESGNSFNEGNDDARRRSSLTSHGMAMKNLVSRGTGLPRESDPIDEVKENAIIESDQGVAEVDSVTTSFALLDAQSPASISSMRDAAEKLPLTTTEGNSTTLLTGPHCIISHDEDIKYSNNHVSCFDKGTLEAHLDNGICYDNSQSDDRPRSGIYKPDEHSVEYDSQYEDGELRESSIHAWKGYDGEDGETEYGSENKGTSSDLGIVNAQESSFHYGPEGSSRIRVADAGSVRGSDMISSTPCFYFLLPEKIHSSDKGSGSGPDEMISGNGRNKRQEDLKDASLSAEWKMNLSAWDMLPENRKSSSGIVTKFRDCSTRKVSSGVEENGTDAEDLEAKVNGSRLYGRESLSHIGGPSSRDAIHTRGRFRMQGCSSRDADHSTLKYERESGPLRSFGRGRYSPPATGRGGDTWNHCLESNRSLKHLHSPSYQGTVFHRSGVVNAASVDNITKEGGMEPSDAGRQTGNSSSHVARRSFRSRSPADRQDGFRVHSGLRPTGDTSHDRFASVGRGRSVRYVSRFNGEGPRGRYHGPAGDDYRESSLEYSHHFSRRRRCYSPIERRGNPYGHHRSISRSPSRSRTRSPVGNCGFSRRSSRSPNFRSYARLRRTRSPNYRRDFEADHVTGFMSGPRNHTSPPPNSKWLNYKQRSSAFDRKSPMRIDPQGERFGFYDSSRKLKQNEYYRYEHPGRFSELNGVGRGGPRFMENDDDRPNHGYRHGPVRRYHMDGAVKRFRYEDEDGFGSGYDSRDKDASEFHGRLNPKAISNGIDSRISNFPRRPREDRDSEIRRRDRKYNSDTKSLGVRQGDEDVSASRTRPS